MTFVRRKLDSLQTDWISLHDELDRAHMAERESATLAAQIQAENGMIGEQLDRTTTELNFWRSYALEMETRLDVIAGVISEAQGRARARAKEEATRPNTDNPEHYSHNPQLRAVLRAVQTDENDGAEELISRLDAAPNQYQ
jgi:hypothetical protein